MYYNVDYNVDYNVVWNTPCSNGGNALYVGILASHMCSCSHDYKRHTSARVVMTTVSRVPFDNLLFVVFYLSFFVFFTTIPIPGITADIY